MEALLSDDLLLPVSVSIATGIVIMAIAWYVLSSSRGGGEKPAAEDEAEPPQSAKEDKEVAERRVVGKAKKAAKQFGRKPSNYSHALLAADLKGHTGLVLDLDFDVKGKYLLSCSEDRSVRLWLPKSFTDKSIKYVNVKVDLDHGTSCCMSPDGKAFILIQEGTQTVHIYKLTKKQDGKIIGQPSLEFQRKQHNNPIIAVGIASSGKFIMTCCEEKFVIWSLKGDILATVTTHMQPNSYAMVSPCGRFVVCTGFTPDVKLWHVQFSKGGDYQQVLKAMELAGHRAGVHYCSISADSTRIATVSKDGTWKLWNIDVEYQKREDPKLLLSQNLSTKGQSLIISLSPDAHTVAVAIDQSIYLYGCSTGALLECMNNCHEGAISSMCWSPDSQMVCSGGGKVIHVWHNEAGLEETLRDLKNQIDTATSEAHKRRLLEQIKEMESQINDRVAMKTKTQ